MESPKMTILHVEDNPGDARLFQEGFEQYAKNEFKLVHEDTLQKALGRLSKEEVDVILLDLFLPDAVGLETLSKVKEASSRAPIIVLTGLFDQKMAFQGLQMGASCFFAKEHVQGNTLVKVMREYAAQRIRAPIPG